MHQLRRPARARSLVVTAAALITVAGAAGPASTASGASPGSVPDLDRPALRAAVSGLPEASVTAAQVRVTGSSGHWLGRGGVRDLVTGRPVPHDGRFRIASATKMFTAAIVLQLVHERRLDLEAPVQGYLPGLLPPGYPPIPVRNLLDHTSGLPRSTEDQGNEDPAHFVAHRFDYFTPREVVATATDRPMVFEPGAAQQYNGVNYFIAGLLVERVTGRTFRHELGTRILRPLRLTATTLPAPGNPTVGGRHVHGYVTVDGVPVDVTAQSPYGWAESGVVSTTSDLTRFLSALLRGGLVPRPQHAELFRVPDVPYLGDDNCSRGPDAGRACFSAGLTRTELPGGTVVWGKSGSVPGTTTAAFATRDLARTLVYAVYPTGNRDGSEGPRLQRIVEAAFVPRG